MKIQLRKNPKTTGWARRAAIALLSGLAAFVVSLPVAFFLFLSHYQSAYPNDTQNILSALTASVLVGLGLAAVAFTAALGIALLFSVSRPSPAPNAGFVKRQ